MGLITQQYERLTDLNQKLKIVRDFMTANYDLVLRKPELLRSFNISINKIILKFAAGENKTIKLLICDTDWYVLNILCDVRSMEHFYFEGTILLKIHALYEDSNGPFIVDSKTGTMKRFVMPVRMVEKKESKHSGIGILRNNHNGRKGPIKNRLRESYPSPKNQINPEPTRRTQPTIMQSVESSSRFQKLFE